MAKTVSKEKVTRFEGTEKEKLKKLDEALLGIEKKFGKGSIMKLGENQSILNVERFSTGILSFDRALCGGLPKGRIIEIYGGESGGKTTTTEKIASEVQKQGGVVAFIDAEHALDPNWCKKVGVDIDNLYISQPDSGEQALEICETMVRSGAVDLIIVDSVSALVPQAEIDGDMGDAVMGLQARLMSQALRKLTPIVGKSKTTVIFINQLREKIGVMFGNPQTTTGGKALKFYSTIRVEMVGAGEKIMVGGEQVGKKVKLRVVKNKVAPPFREAQFDIMFEDDEVISSTGDLIEVGTDLGIIEKSGAWITYNGEKLGQGNENAKKKLKEDKKLFETIKAEVVKAMEKEYSENMASGEVSVDDEEEPLDEE